MTHHTGHHDTELITTPPSRSPLLRPRVLVPVAVAALTLGLGFGLSGATDTHQAASTAVAGEQPAPVPVDTSLPESPVVVTEGVSDERPSPAQTTPQSPPAPQPEGTTEPEGTTNNGQPAPQPQGQPQPAPQPPPAPQPQPAPQPPPGPASFEVPDTVVLPTNVYSGSFLITNTGGEAFEWTAFNFVGTQVHTPGGSLEPGEQATISFTVDQSNLEDGPFPEHTGVEVDVDGVGAKQVRVKGLRLTTIMAPA